MHWLGHVLGLDSQNTPYYLFWSGVGPHIPTFVLTGAWYRRNHCHAPRCARIGRHTADGTPWCTRHRPTP